MVDRLAAGNVLPLQFTQAKIIMLFGIGMIKLESSCQLGVFFELNVLKEYKKLL